MAPVQLFKRCPDAAGGESNAGTSMGPENSGLSGSGHETFTGDAGGFSGQAGHDSADTEAVLVRAPWLSKQRVCIMGGLQQGQTAGSWLCVRSIARHSFDAFLACSQTLKLLVHLCWVWFHCCAPGVHLQDGPARPVAAAPSCVHWTPLWPGRCALLPAGHHCSCSACVCRDQGPLPAPSQTTPSQQGMTSPHSSPGAPSCPSMSIRWGLTSGEAACTNTSCCAADVGACSAIKCSLALVVCAFTAVIAQWSARMTAAGLGVKVLLPFPARLSDTHCN